MLKKYFCFSLAFFQIIYASDQQKVSDYDTTYLTYEALRAIQQTSPYRKGIVSTNASGLLPDQGLVVHLYAFSGLLLVNTTSPWTCHTQKHGPDLTVEQFIKELYDYNVTLSLERADERRSSSYFTYHVSSYNGNPIPSPSGYTYLTRDIYENHRIDKRYKNLHNLFKPRKEQTTTLLLTHIPIPPLVEIVQDYLEYAGV